MIDEPVQNACGSRRKPNSVGGPENPLLGPGAEVLGDRATGRRRTRARSRGRSRHRGCWRRCRRIRARRRPCGGRSECSCRRGRPCRADSWFTRRPAIGQPLAIAFELLAVGEPVVGGQHGLGPLQVGVAGQDDAGVAFGTGRRTPAAEFEPAGRRCASIASRTQRRRSVETWSLRLRPVWSLRPTSPMRSISARSMFMWTSSSSWRNCELAGGDLVADLLQAGDDLVALVVREDADLGQHVGVGDRAADIVGVEAAVEAHAFGELLDAAVGRLVEDTAPRLVGHLRSRCGVQSAAAGRAHITNESNIFRVNGLRRIVNEVKSTTSLINRQEDACLLPVTACVIAGGKTCQRSDRPRQDSLGTDEYTWLLRL